MLEATILILSITLLISFLVIANFYFKINKLKDKINKLKTDVKKTEDLIEIEPGDKALIPNYALNSRAENESFTVNYEVEILEVSIDKVKVKAIDYTSLDKFAKDPANKASIINFLQNHWVSKKDIQLIIDDQVRRDKKLKQLGIL